jgi:ChrR Cupin-like domain
MMINPLNHKSNSSAFVNDDQQAPLNADYALPVVINSMAMDWNDSPMLGVQRKRLELIGSSSPRLTTLVRFAPDSYFKSHQHDAGEEFLVIEGVFSDASGDYGKGYYVRNPADSSHQPYTKEGCIILVKLRQFSLGDIQQCAIDTQNSTWAASKFKGISQLLLHQYQSEHVFMYQLNKDSESFHISFSTIGEVYVLGGEINILSTTYSAGTWLRYPANTSLSINSHTEARIWVKRSADIR